MASQLASLEALKMAHCCFAVLVAVVVVVALSSSYTATF